MHYSYNMLEPILCYIIPSKNFPIILKFTNSSVITYVAIIPLFFLLNDNTVANYYTDIQDIVCYCQKSNLLN